MKAKPFKLIDDREYIPCAVEEASHVMIQTPGPLCNRFMPVMLKGRREGSGKWTWNGNTERPTLMPSILTTTTDELTDDELDRIKSGEKVEPREIRCHTWITDGKVQFLPDCSHEFAGQTLDLLDID